MPVRNWRLPVKHPNELSAWEAAVAIRAGTLTSVSLVEACLERIAQREPQVGAWQCLDADAALEQARRCDAHAPGGLLHGVPIGIKDIIDTRDLPTGRGSSIYRDTRMAWDAACVALARRAGAIVLGKTVTTEFAYFQPGKTRNPHNLAHTPGGSSSGSAAAVADRMVPIALGSQTAGSLTRPASYCGVVGYKATYRDFNLAGIKPFASSLDTLGTLTRTVEDALLMRSVLLGLPFKLPAALPALPLRVGLCRTPWWTEADIHARLGIEDLFARLAQTDAEVGQVVLPPGCDGLMEAQKLVMAYEAAASMAFEYDAHRDDLSAPLRELIEQGLSIARADYLLALASAEQARRELATLFEHWDVLLTPAAHGEAPAGMPTGDPLFSRIWTLLGVPTVALPAFSGPNGLPVGIQVVGARGEDARLLHSARLIRDAIGLPGSAGRPSPVAPQKVHP